MDTRSKFTNTLIDTSNNIFYIKNRITDNEYLIIMNRNNYLILEHNILNYIKKLHRKCDCVLTFKLHLSLIKNT